MTSKLHKQGNSRPETAAAGGGLPGISCHGEAGSADLLNPPSEDGAQRVSEPPRHPCVAMKKQKAQKGSARDVRLVGVSCRDPGNLGLPPQSEGKGEGPVSCRDAESGGRPGLVRPDLPGRVLCPLCSSHPTVDLRGARQTGTLRPGCVLNCLRRRGGTAGQRPREAPQGLACPTGGPRMGAGDACVGLPLLCQVSV